MDGFATGPVRGANELLADLAAIGRTRSGGYTRTSWDDATMELREWFSGAASDLGLDLEEDGNGNQVAWWGRGDDALLIGSHLDSVADGGPLDGPLGVASALSTVAALRASGWRPSRPIAVANFADEEGARFGVACLGSRLVTGAIAPERALGLRDEDGTSLAEAMAARGRDPRAAGTAEWLSRIGTFVELHVEQGRWLAPHDSPVGVASSIWPHGRYRFDFCGQSNHAGTTAIADRHDPMLAYAATVLAARELVVAGSSATADVGRATFGRVRVAPGSTNSIPSRVSAWLDARAESGPELERLVGELVARAERAASDAGTTVTMRAESTTGAVEFDHTLRHRIASLLDVPVLPTAAGHDAGILATRLPAAMLFVRNPTGISHAPQESADAADIDAGTAALTGVVRDLAGVATGAGVHGERGRP
jgi:N-carbamoyl-L-amino-acid hydrolase